MRLENVKTLAFLLVTLLMVGTSVSAGNKPETPTDLPGGLVVSASEALALSERTDVQFVDTRNIMNYGRGHVPGAITASYREKSDYVADFDASLDRFDLEKLPADKHRTLVIYSDGPTGWKSYKAARACIAAGFTDVRYFRGGFAKWTAAGYPVER